MASPVTSLAPRYDALGRVLHVERVPVAVWDGGWYEVPLTQGKFALIDLEHVSAVARYTWCADRHRNTFYASVQIRDSAGARKKIYLHQLVWELLGNSGPVDHKNGDGLDCRTGNLRVGLVSLNGANQRKQSRKTSSVYKGVSWYPSRFKWNAYIKVDGTKKNLGYFVKEEQAALAYDRAALAAWGEYAKPNFPVSL